MGEGYFVNPAELRQRIGVKAFSLQRHTCPTGELEDFCVSEKHHTPSGVVVLKNCVDIAVGFEKGSPLSHSVNAFLAPDLNEAYHPHPVRDDLWTLVTGIHPETFLMTLKRGKPGKYSHEWHHVLDDRDYGHAKPFGAFFDRLLSAPNGVGHAYLVNAEGQLALAASHTPPDKPGYKALKRAHVKVHHFG